MRTGLKFGSLVILGILCLGCFNPANASTANQRKSKKPQLPPLPSGPLGPIPQIPLDSTPAVAPHVSYTDGQLTIMAPNSTLGDILRAVRKQTSAEMDIPANVNERVVTQLGPGPARAVLAELLNGSRFNYVLLGSPEDATVLTRVVLVAKTGAEPPVAGTQAQPVPDQAGNVAQAQQPPPEDGEVAEIPDADPAEENADENPEPNAAEAEQQQQQPGAGAPDQAGIKTPQQMLQEMQQRQLQMQQQQAPGQPPVPGGAYPQAPQRPQQQQ